MNRFWVAAFAHTAACAALAAALPAQAVTCYQVVDRSDTIIYRSTVAPVDLSAAGAPEREAMRRRGEALMFFDTETCIVVGSGSGTVGGAPMSTEEIVAGWKAFGSKGGWGTYSSRYGGASTSGQVFAPTPSPSGPAVAPAAPAGPVPITVGFR